MSDTSSPPDDAGSPADAPDPVVPERRVAAHPRPPRPGDLSLGWRAITAGTWIGVVVGLAAVWNASVQLGLSTWWLGARGEPQPTIVQFTPFIAPVLMLLATINQVRWLPWCGLAASVAVAGFAAGNVMLLSVSNAKSTICSAGTPRSTLYLTSLPQISFSSRALSSM